MSTKSNLAIYAAVCRIESAPNMTAVIKAYDAAHEETTDVSAHRHLGRWQVWHGEYAGFCGDFAEVRSHLAARAEETLERELDEATEAAASKPAMVPTPAQLQQANASIDRAVAKAIPGLRKNSFPLTPLNKLRHGHDQGAPAGVCNVRVSGRDAGLDELAASIASIGLLQPLVVVKSGDLSYVADGNRRLAALLRLAAAGTIAEDHEVDVVERDAATAREAGLAANMNQCPMHEADQVAAFSEMEQDGVKPKDIAVRFGVSLPHVKRLLALGSVAPCILDAWRAGKHAINVDDVKAFTVAPSIEDQERVYAKLSKAGGSISSYQIRAELGADRSTESMLKQVGLDAYKAAGGSVIKDLFGDSHGVSDRALLQRLSNEKLIARRDELRAEGWSWAEIDSDLPSQARYSWSTLHSTRREPTETEAARLREIEAITEADDDGGVSDEEVQALTVEHRTIEKGLIQQPGADDKARSGCVVSWQYDNTIHVREFVMRPEDVKAAKASTAADGETPEPEAKGLSSALVDRLSVQLTQAVQDSFETAPRAALAGLLAGATCKFHWGAPIRLRLEGLDGEKAKAGDNETFEVLFNRFLGMDDPDMLAALGRVLGRGVDLRTRTPGSGATAGCPADSPAIQALAGAMEPAVLKARMADRFDAADFFGSAPKTVAIAAIEEACGAEAAARAGKLKKAEIVAVALAEVVPTAWLPREIRWPGYTGPGAEIAVSKAVPAMVPQPVQQQQANAGVASPPVEQPETLSAFEIDRRERALTNKFDLAVHKCNVLREVYKETYTRYWESRRTKSPNARHSKQDVHDRHVSDEMAKRGEAALVEMNAAFDALEAFWRQRGTKIEPLLMVAQPVQQQQANAGAAPAPVPSRLLAVVHGPDGADDPRLGGLAALRDLLRACWDQRAFLALLGEDQDEIALCETIRSVEDLYRRLAQLVGQRTDIHDREHPDRVAEDQAWLDAGGGIPF